MAPQRSTSDPSADLVSLVLATLSSLADPNENPYDFLKLALERQVVPRAPNSVLWQFDFLAALIALYVLAPPRFTSVLPSMAEGEATKLKQRTNDEHSGYARTSSGFVGDLRGTRVSCDHTQPSVWCTGAIATWTVWASLTDYSHSLGRRVGVSTLLCNILGIGAPVVYLAAVVPLGVIGGRAMSCILRDYHRMQRILDAAAADWDPGEPFDMQRLVPSLVILQDAMPNLVKLVTYSRAIYIFQACATVFQLSLVLVGGTKYLWYLKRTIRSGEAVMGPGGISDGGSAKNRIRKTLNALHMTIVAFSLLAGGCLVVAIYGATHPLTLHRTLAANVLALCPLYIFALLALPCSIIVLKGACEANRLERTDERRASVTMIERGRTTTGGAIGRSDNDAASDAGSEHWTGGRSGRPATRPGHSSWSRRRLSTGLFFISSLRGAPVEKGRPDEEDALSSTRSAIRVTVEVQVDVAEDEEDTSEKTGRPGARDEVNGA
ncbi:hypothetical protein JCM10212_006482 [Sporobolomyces blumeae]